MVNEKIIPSAVGDIHMRDRNPKPTIESSFEFTPQNPFTIDVDVEENPGVAYPGFTEKHGFFESAVAEFQSKSTNYQLLRYNTDVLPEKPSQTAQYLYPGVGESFIFKDPPPGWSAKEEMEKLSNIDSKFKPKLLAARNPQDFQYRLEDVYNQQKNDEILQNGSTFGMIMGGLVGYSPIGSIENFIPLSIISTKGKVAAGFLTGMMQSAPSMLAASAIREGAYEMNKVDRNLPTYLTNTFVDAAFATVLFGGIGAGKAAIDISELRNITEYAKKYFQGVGFDFVLDAKGNVTGYKAVPLPGEAENAALVTKAQEYADAAFHKGGIFKIPYLGSATYALITGNVPGFKYVFGSPIARLKSSTYRAAQFFADRGFDHFFTTVGEVAGRERPPSFELKMKETKSLLTSMYSQLVSLHAERNGYTIVNRPAIGIQNAWSAMKQKSLEAINRQTKSTNNISQADFMDEIQQVLYSEVSSEHAAVNEGAAMYRKVIDDTWRDYRAAYNLPENWLPPKTAAGYLMRVYDTQFMNSQEGEQLWMNVVSNWLKESDAVIERQMEPITNLRNQIKEFEAQHTEMVRQLGSNKAPKMLESKLPERNSNELKLSAMKNRLKSMEETLQDRLREDPDLLIHVDDVSKFSAKEAKELTGILKPVNDVKEKIDEQKSLISNLKKEKSQKLSAAKTSPTAEKAKPKAEKFVGLEERVAAEEAKLKELEDELLNVQDELSVKAHNGEINPRYYYKDENVIKFKNPNERLQFRDVHESDLHRQTAARAYYDSIMHMHPQDIIADTFGKLSGRPSENMLKSRTLMIPDKILYNNGFMTKDLHAKTANYVTYLARRTHLKTSFDGVTIHGDYKELAADLLDEHKSRREEISQRINALNEKLNSASESEKKAITKEIAAENKSFNKEIKTFNEAKKDIKYLFENRMMGLNRRNDFDNMLIRTWMSLTAAANLHNLPAMQITDLAFGGFQHGLWPFARDAVYPIINSMAGMLKTNDSEALREMAPHINLGYQDMLNNYADRNWSQELQPYINMGKIQSGVEKYAHFSALADLTPYIDNGLQHAHGSVIQSRFMELLHKQLDGSLSEKDALYLRKYGINPELWAERMVNAYKTSGGRQTALGGYISKAWAWQDLEAANLFNRAVFRGVNNTLVWKGMADSPFFADNILGMFFHTFTGWGYAATNRYLIPSLQHPDGALLLKMMWMAGAGSLVSPTRRISRGEEPWPDDMKPEQIAWEAFSDSGVLSSIGNVLNLANFFTDNKLLGDLKNDKFAGRTRTGIFGMSDVISSTANRMSDVLGMAQSGLNEKDMKTAAHMSAFTGSMYFHWAGDKIIESWNLPRHKRAAQSQ